MSRQPAGMDYHGPDNIYWLFSSSAQAIAAFIGFLAAGFFFVYDRIDKQVEKDETLEEIYADIKSRYYTGLKVLFILTGLSVILSLLVVFLNGYNMGGWGIAIRTGVALLDVITIGWAIWFIIFIIDPDKVKRTAQKLINENKTVFEPSTGETLTTGQYLDKFTELEQLLKDIAAKRNIAFRVPGRYRDSLPLGEIIRQLYQQRLINPRQFKELSEVNKIRNLAAHGEMRTIEMRQGALVDTLITQLRNAGSSNGR